MMPIQGKNWKRGGQGTSGNSNAFSDTGTVQGACRAGGRWKAAPVLSVPGDAASAGQFIEAQEQVLEELYAPEEAEGEITQETEQTESSKEETNEAALEETEESGVE